MTVTSLRPAEKACKQSTHRIVGHVRVSTEPSRLEGAYSRYSSWLSQLMVDAGESARHSSAPAGAYSVRGSERRDKCASFLGGKQLPYPASSETTQRRSLREPLSSSLSVSRLTQP
jgi:hypothetical protein